MPAYSDKAVIRELFLDDVEVEAVDRLGRIVHQPKLLSDEPVLRPERPWEGTQTAPKAVMYDPALGRFRLWYQTYRHDPGSASPAGWEGPALRAPSWCYGVGYAESEDGLVWSRPGLGRVTVGGEDTNLAIRGWSSPSPQAIIHRPRHPDPKERYRLYVWDELPVPGHHSTIGMSTYVSPDGYAWQGLEWARSASGFDDPQPYCYVKHVGNYRYPTSIGPGECNSLFYDPAERTYVNYCRANNGSVRSIGRMESLDGIHWTRPRLVCQPDLGDPHRFQFYSAGAMRCGESTVLLLHCCHMADWSIDCQLATSRDGYHFTRVADRRVFMPLGRRGSATGGMLFPLAPIPYGDHWLIFAGACPVGHREEEQVTSTVVYGMRPEGFVSFRAGHVEGSLVTRNLCWLHDDVVLNADARSGFVRLEVLPADGVDGGVIRCFDDPYPAPLPGFSKDDCVPLASDALAHTVRFRDADLRTLRGAHVKFRIYLRNADLFSWTRQRTGSGEPPGPLP